VPPTLSAQQTLDWITFTTEFVSAAVSIDEDRLDQAMSGECSFREALGLGMNGKSREEWLQLEEVWASDEGAGVMTYKSLQKFMTKNSHAKESLFTRLVETRDWWETQLAAL
jgi:hypothetical protein